MIKKLLGLILLFLGLAVIFCSLFSSFNIFTAKTNAPEIFKLEKQDYSQKESQGTESQLQEMVSGQLKDIIPITSIASLLNLIAWSVFAGILILGGAQIAGLGIKLLT